MHYSCDFGQRRLLVFFKRLPQLLYADDTQLYVPFKIGSDDLLSSAKFSIEMCVQEINNGMIVNGLKLNEEKTESLLPSSRYRPSPSLEFVRVGGETIQPSSSVRNLGVILDSSVDVKDHIKKICKTCHFHLTNISKIRSHLDCDSTEAIIHAFVTINLDYCNAILYGLPKVLLSRLQIFQNRAARIVTFTKKYEHITPSLMALHWLPVDYRIIYKILCWYIRLSMVFHQVINPICSVFLVAPTLCVLVRISYFKSRDLTLSLMVIDDFLLRDPSYGIAYLHL